MKTKAEEKGTTEVSTVEMETVHRAVSAWCVDARERAQTSL